LGNPPAARARCIISLQVAIMSQQLLQVVSATVNEVIVENGGKATELAADTDLLSETALDSIGLALVVVKLEEKTGKDPFKDGFVRFQTLGELVALYADG